MKARKRALSALLAVTLLLGALPVRAFADEDDPNIITHAFNRDIEKVVDDYVEKKDWDKSKIESPPESWTGIKGDDCKWINDYQKWLWFDNAYTTAEHLWGYVDPYGDESGSDYSTGNGSSLGIGLLKVSADRSVSNTTSGDAGAGGGGSPGGGSGGSGGGGGSSDTLGLPSVSGSDLVSIAQSQLGVGEQPPGSNYVEYVKWYCNFSNSTPVSSYRPWEWCCIFVVWCAAQAGYIDWGKNGKFAWTGGCGPQSAYLRNTQGCRYVFTSDVFNDEDLQDEVQPGDIVFFSTGMKSLTSSTISHIGIVESTGHDSGGFYIRTIEGNAGTNGVVGRYTYHKNTYRPFTNGHIVRPNL